ncbi:MAG: hypothetical protein SAJ37_13580 [Oscillatoria sp. PMC 1068.18]|nr:hypothetical protein [Oscillatoria sp. PMC 1076.18]MEC4989756.1 hypothetical protein [Oscillatoria sp. PMC 1068.18]
MSKNQALITNPIVKPTQLLTSLQSGQNLRITSPRGSAVIICHSHHADLAGPGAAVGGMLDTDCRRVIPIGKLALQYPEISSDRQKAFKIRQRWIQAIQKVTLNPMPLQRAKILLVMLEKYCGLVSLQNVPDEVLAQLVGVLPQTMTAARQVVTAATKKAQKDILPNNSIKVSPTSKKNSAAKQLNYQPR